MHYFSLSNHALHPDDLENVIKGKYSLSAYKDAARIVSEIRHLKPCIELDTSEENMFNLNWLCSIVLRIGYEMGRKDRRKE